MQLISADSLANYMRFRDTSVRALAMKVGVSRALIGHLRSGYRTTCDPDVARKIARSLDVPIEVLFAPRTFHVPVNRNGRRAA